MMIVANEVIGDLAGSSAVKIVLAASPERVFLGAEMEIGAGSPGW
jgi:hypothetical protein